MFHFPSTYSIILITTLLQYQVVKSTDACLSVTQTEKVCCNITCYPCVSLEREMWS